MRNYGKSLTLALAGDGVSDIRNSEALLDDFIFGDSDDAVDVKLLVPFDGPIQPSLEKAIGVLKQWGVDGKDFIPVVEPNAGHKHIASAETTVQVSQGGSTEEVINWLLAEKEKGNDVVFISIFDPESTKDLAAVTDVKAAGLPTLNMALGLVDTFPGYESAAERMDREAKQAAFDAEQKEKAATEKPPRKTAAKKTAAKKSTAPRKATVSKSLEAEDVPLTDEPEKPAQAPQMAVGDTVEVGGLYFTKTADSPFPEHNKSGLDSLVAQAVAREAEKKAARLELSGTIVAGKSELPKDLEPAKPVAPTVDVWQDIAQAAKSGDMITVRKSDIVELGEAMQKMADGFTSALDVYKRMATGE